jgi:hypothetical protein
MTARAWGIAALVALGCDGGTGSSGPPPGTVLRVLYGIDTANTLVRFTNTAPGTVTRTLGVTGLQTGERILGIEFRLADGKLYALGSTSRLYTVDTATGAATQVGTGAFAPALVGATAGFGLDPVADRFRVHGGADENLLLHPLTGVVTDTGTPIGFDTSDVNAGTDPGLAGTASTGERTPAPAAATLFAIDTVLDILVTLGNPATGRLVTVGPLDVATGGFVGFDIVATDSVAYAALTAPAGGPSRLYFLDLATGHATLIGVIGGGRVLRGLAVAR